ncbi:unnamed protein product [Ectocarpus sp. CCAP 1310/34]|nr:unnamed protein product [Ectocarpus sp. CCAP 1310/34]
MYYIVCASPYYIRRHSLAVFARTQANMLGGESSKKTAVGPGEKTARGVAANVMSVYAYGFVGPARMQFSGGGPANAPLTNPFLALGLRVAGSECGRRRMMGGSVRTRLRGQGHR